MEFSHPSDQRFDTIIEAGTGSIYRVRQDEAQPLSLLYPLDRAALRRLYDPNAMGPWSERALHVAGHGTRAAFVRGAPKWLCRTVGVRIRAACRPR